MTYKTLSLPINVAILLCAILIPHSAQAKSNNLTNKNQSIKNSLKDVWTNSQSLSVSRHKNGRLKNLTETKSTERMSAEQMSAEAKSAEAKSAEAKSAEQMSTEQMSTEQMSAEAKPTKMKSTDTKATDTKSIDTNLNNKKRISQVPQNFQNQQPFPRTAPQSVRAMQNAQNSFYRQYAQQPQPPMLTNGKLLVTTTNEVPGYRIVKYNGIVRGDVVFGPTIIQAFKSSIKSIIGGKLGGYTQMCQRARENAFEDMLNQARQLGANAIVGVQYDSSTFRTSKDGDVGTEVFCYGTAVSVIPQ